MYVIPDTDVWTEFFEKENAEFEELLEQGRILVSPLVIDDSFGPEAIALLMKMPKCPQLSRNNLARCIAEKNLNHFGLTESQIALLATAITAEAKLWSKARALRTIATVFGACFFERD